MAVNFLLKRSSVADKRPTALQLDIGELSLNYDQGTPGLFFEDDAGNVRKIGPTEVGGTAPNVAPAGQSGNSTGEMWLDSSGTPLLKTWDGSAWRVAGATTIGSTAISLGSSSTTIAGLTSLTSADVNATTSVDLENQADLRFYEATANGANYVGFQAPASIGADVLWTLPAADGTSGQVLKTDGSGTLAWVSPGAASAGGSNTQVQYNSSGTLAGSANFTFDGSNVQIGSQGDLRLADSDSSHYVGLQAPASVASSITFTLPGSDGTNGQALVTNGSGALSFATVVQDVALSKEVIGSDLTILSGYNAASFLTADIDAGVTVEIPAGQDWMIIDPGAVAIKDEGSTVTLGVTSINFIGGGVAVSDVDSLGSVNVTVNGLSVQDEGVTLSSAVSTVNFTGGGVTASGSGGTVTVNVPAVSGGLAILGWLGSL